MITNLDGREIVTLVDKQMSQGRFTTQWNGSDASANACAAGTYLATSCRKGDTEPAGVCSSSQIALPIGKEPSICME
ncbi:MAG: hypothetical protein IPO87_18950 [Flavobacteriales bacterium]|nr:hypothetical protein [Flavobacteriales bacterium]